MDLVMSVITVIGLATIGYGLGWGAALGLKTAARSAGCLIIAVFILLQVLTYYGLVELEWGWASRYLHAASGLAHWLLRRLWGVLLYNLPFAAGFGLGFLRTFRPGAGGL